MELSVAVASERAPASAFVVWRGFEAAIRKAIHLGFDGVELALRSAEEFEAENLQEILKRYNFKVSCISTGQVFAVSGLWFTHPELEMRKKTVQEFKNLIRIAAGYGQIINMGRARGFVGDGQTRAEVEEMFADGLAEILPDAKEHGVTLVIEPVNRYETNFLNSVEETAAFARRISHPNLKIMPDVFHMNLEDRDMQGVLRENADLLGYIHLADSNRHYPGDGHLDFPALLGTLQEIGYDGWCSLEILPVPTPDLAAERGIQFLKPIFNRMKGGR